MPRHRFAGGRRLAVTTLVRQPGRRARLGEQVEQHRRLAHGRDRLEGEEVHAGLEEGLDARAHGRRAGRSSPRVVVAACTPSRRRASPRTARPTRPRAVRRSSSPVSVANRSRARCASIDAPPDGLERGRAIQAGRREPRDRRLVACRRRDLRPGPVIREMDRLDRIRFAQQQARRPQPVGQVVTGRLELGRQAAVDDRTGPPSRSWPMTSDDDDRDVVGRRDAPAEVRHGISERGDDVVRRPPAGGLDGRQQAAARRTVRPTGRSRRSPRPCTARGCLRAGAGRPARARPGTGTRRGARRRPRWR